MPGTSSRPRSTHCARPRPPLLPAVAVLFAAVLAGPSAAPELAAQQGTTGGNWLYYGGDAGSTKYAPLDQITADNVADLEVAWRWESRNFGDRPEFNYRVTPLAVGRHPVRPRRATGGRWSPSTGPPARPCGCTAWTRGCAPRPLPAPTPDAGSLTGPTARRSASW